MNQERQIDMDPSKTSQNNPYLFIDTCIIQAAGSAEKLKSGIIIKILQEIAEEYRLAISEFTLYENLHGLWGEKRSQAAKLLRVYERKVVSDKVLLIASLLGGLYHEEKIDGIDAGDKIIGATAILENGTVLTENHKDYPHPFFITKKYIPLTYFTSGRYNKTIDLAIYGPNRELISRRIQEIDTQK